MVGGSNHVYPKQEGAPWVHPNTCCNEAQMQGHATKETGAKYKDGLQNLCLVTIVGELVDDLITMVV